MELIILAIFATVVALYLSLLISFNAEDEREARERWVDQIRYYNTLTEARTNYPNLGR